MSRHVISSTINGKLLLFNTLDGNYYELNKTGARIWELLEQDRSPAEISQQLANEYEVPAQIIEADVVHLIALLETETLLADVSPYYPADDQIAQLRQFFQSRPVKPRLSICIPSMNRLDLLVPCLLSLLSTEQTEIIVADSGSDAATFDFYDRAKVPVLKVPGEFNFSKSCNVAASAAESDLLLFLNSDTKALVADWEQRLLAIPNHGATGAVLIYPSAILQHVGVEVLPIDERSVDQPHCYKSRESHLPVMLRHIGRSRMLDQLDTVSMHRLMAVTGAFLCTPKRVYTDLGGMDESYQADLQDIDYCLKVSEKNLPLAVCKDIVFMHVQSASRGAYAFPEDDWALFTRRWAERLLTYSKL